MEKAWIDDNIELFRKADSYRLNIWESIMKQQHDLVYFGHFSFLDSESMVPVERKKFLELTVQRYEQEHPKRD